MKLNTTHTIAKRILDTHQNAFIGLEELSGIRDRTRRKHGKKATKKQRRANRHASAWAFAELYGLLAYKAVLAGSRLASRWMPTTPARPARAVAGPAKRTGPGRACSLCVSSATTRCTLIWWGPGISRLRTLVIRQDWMATGKPVRCP